MGPAMAALLLGRIEQEAKAGVVTADRAALLTQLLDDFMRAVPAADDDVRTHEQKTARLREIVARLTDTMASQSRRDPQPVSESQAERVDAMLGPLQQLLVREMAGRCARRTRRRPRASCSPGTSRASPASSSGLGGWRSILISMRGAIISGRTRCDMCLGTGRR